MSDEFVTVVSEKKEWKLPNKRWRLCSRCGENIFSHKNMCQTCRLKRDSDEGRQGTLERFTEVK